MRIALTLMSAAVLLAGLSVPAAAQVPPPGSYLHSCRDVRLQGRTLVALCRRGDGRWRPAALPEAGRCIGDIRNVDGTLRCNGNGLPPPHNRYRERRALCGRIAHAVDATRRRLEHARPALERRRLERRLHALRMQQHQTCRD